MFRRQADGQADLKSKYYRRARIKPKEQGKPRRENMGVKWKPVAEGLPPEAVATGQDIPVWI